MTPLIDLTGKKFGTLKVLSFHSKTRKNGKTKVLWNCLCDCGKTVAKSGELLRDGKTKSCGDNKHNIATWSAIGRSNKKELSRNTSECWAWRSAKCRCSCPTHKQYSDYGGRGITMCEEWQDNYEAFYEYMGPKPGKEWTLDRIDVNGNYEPGNVRWATHEQQQQNKRANRFTPETVREIRESPLSRKELKHKYDVGATTIAKILTRVTWKNVK
jgi:hypothetical protein